MVSRDIQRDSRSFAPMPEPPAVLAPLMKLGKKPLMKLTTLTLSKERARGHPSIHPSIRADARISPIAQVSPVLIVTTTLVLVTAAWGRRCRHLAALLDNNDGSNCYCRFVEKRNHVAEMKRGRPV